MSVNKKKNNHKKFSKLLFKEIDSFITELRKTFDENGYALNYDNYSNDSNDAYEEFLFHYLDNTDKKSKMDFLNDFDNGKIVDRKKYLKMKELQEKIDSLRLQMDELEDK